MYFKKGRRENCSNESKKEDSTSKQLDTEKFPCRHQLCNLPNKEATTIYACIACLIVRYYFLEQVVNYNNMYILTGFGLHTILLNITSVSLTFKAYLLRTLCYYRNSLAT